MSRRGLERVALALIVAASAALAGCGNERPANAATVRPAPEPAVTAEQHEQGRKIYNFRCYFCHGYSGDAKTLAATYLDPKPRNFQETPLEAIPRAAMLAIVKHGKPNTAMAGFDGILTDRELQLVTDFVRQEFMVRKARNTIYHTMEAGWPNHERNIDAFPFARGEIPIDKPWEELNQQQQRGKRLFMRACVTCHDHGKVENAGTVWETRALSYPRDGYCTSCHQDVPRSAPQGAHPDRPATHTFSQPDGSVPIRKPQPGTAVAENFLVHDKAPVLKNPTAQELRGEHLYHRNCAFCHAADGTSKSWIGSFLEPHPRDLTSAQQMKGMTRERLRESIAKGLANTSMPAWKEVMPPQDIEALISYISKAFHPVPQVAKK